MATFTLASASPRRRNLLAEVGLEPDVRPSDVDETPLPDEPPPDYVRRVAIDKARACASDRPVLAADTTVALDGRIYAKAEDAEDAKRMLRALSGRTHQVYTAVVLRVGEAIHDVLVTTQVRFRTLDEAQIERYVATGEPMDKAGAYGIQGRGGALLATVEGSYTNVVGLPVEETLALLAEAGLA